MPILRSLRRDPLLNAAAVGSLALGLAATTAMFAVFNTLLLTAPPYRDGAGLLVFHEVIAELRDQYPYVPASAPHFQEWRRQCRACGELAAVQPVTFTLTGHGDPTPVAAARVSASLFRLLGVQPIAGRDFLDEEDVPGREAVVVLSHGFWRERFAGDPAAVGRTLLLNGQPHQIVGVLPAGFRMPSGAQLSPLVRLPPRVDLFRPIAFSQAEEATAFNYPVIGRLAAGATLEQATAELEAVQADLGRRAPMPMTLGIRLRPLHEQMVGDVRHALVLLMAATALVLLIVCVNVANLLLARYAARRRDAALRLAIGAGRGRLVREALAESAALAAAGCGLGLLLAWWGVDALVALAPAGVPRLDEVAMDLRVVVFATAAAAAAALAFGLLPAMRMSSADPAGLLRSSGAAPGTPPAEVRMRHTLLAVQVGLCVLLLSAGVLVARSHARLAAADTGFRPAGALTFRVALSPATHGAQHVRNQAIADILDRLAAIPGVVAAGIADTLPLSGETNVNIVSLEHDTRPAVARPAANRRYVDAGYFAAAGIPILAGRAFADADRGRAVAVLSARTAAALWPGEPPLGKVLHTGDTDAPLARVIGIAADARTVALAEPDPLMVYEPYWIVGDTTVAFVVRGEADPRGLAGAVRAQVRAVVPDAPVADLRPLDGLVQDALAGTRFQAVLMLICAAAAFAIAIVGVYGVTAYLVSRRLREIGIRSALGARPRDIVRLVVSGTLGPVALGLMAGLAASLGLGRVMAALLFDVPAIEPLALVAVAAVIGAAAAMASLVPARRAARVDPVSVLRQP